MAFPRRKRALARIGATAAEANTLAPAGLGGAMQPSASIRGVLALGLAALIAVPIASAIPVGVDAASVGELNSAGGHASYGQTWVGTWMKSSGWAGYENDLRSLASKGITPVIMWYYWGDAISVNCVQSGCNGMSKGEWDAMAATLAQKAQAILGGKPFLVVMEPEFNKNGINTWETFDGYLANQASIIKRNGAGAKIVLGFGSWGGYDIFDRAAAASDYTGFQYMRASTRHSPAEATAPADNLIANAKDLKSRFGKGVLVFDVAIGSYGGWEWVQQAALRNLQSRAGNLSAAGIIAVIWRYVHDNTYSSGYFGPAESSWGLKYAGGGAKIGWADLVKLSQGGAGGATGSGSTPAPAPGASFTNVHGNSWWIEASIAGSPSSVSARVNGGAWVNLPHTSWGSYAVSTYAPTGAHVDLRATFGGATVTGTYLWPSGAKLG
jgi:hypothetical protein